MDRLNEAWSEASTKMYQQATAAGQQAPGAGPEGAPAGGGASVPQDDKRVEDAQYEVVDDKNKK
jgi:hypothetical protein